MASRNNNMQASPKYWWLLSELDRTNYTYLRTFIKNNPESNQRNKRLTSFTDMLEIIRRFAIRGDAGDANRCLVCGILWLPGAIAINTHQLGFLMAKCKSSINGSLQILGYKETISRKTASDLVAKALLAIRDDRSELRKWTVRCIDDSLLDLSSLNEGEQQHEKQDQEKQESVTEKVTAQQPIQLQYQPVQLTVAPQVVQPFNYLPIQNQIQIQPQLQQQIQYQVEQKKEVMQNNNKKSAVKTQKEDNNIEFHPFSNFDFPVPPKKGQCDAALSDLCGDPPIDVADFSKEDAFISNALSGFNENSLDSSNDFWNIEMLQSDSFFL